MKMRATFIIDIEAKDYVSAADHQRAVERLLGVMREEYPRAQLNFKAIRAPGPQTKPSTKVRGLRGTGNLSAYEEAR